MFNRKQQSNKKSVPRTARNKAATISLSEINSELLIERQEAEILIAYLLNKTRESVLIHPETRIDISIYNKLNRLQQKRLKNYPIAYLTGQKEFYGLDFKVNKNVLVPRPETEIMVENIIDIFKPIENGQETNGSKKSKIITNPLIIDIGTGSGAIIISLASELKKLFPRDFKNFKFKAIDISAGALKIAKDNAKFHNLKTIKFYQGNLLNPIVKSLTIQNLIIAANLPYLTPAQIKKSPSISREPKLALVAGNDGLKYYRELFKQLKNIKYKSLTLFCEIDSSQSDSITYLAKNHFPQTKLKIIKDLAGLDRFLEVASL